MSTWGKQPPHVVGRKSEPSRIKNTSSTNNQSNYMYPDRPIRHRQSQFCSRNDASLWPYINGIWRSRQSEQKKKKKTHFLCVVFPAQAVWILICLLAPSTGRAMQHTTKTNGNVCILGMGAHFHILFILIIPYSWNGKNIVVVTPSDHSKFSSQLPGMSLVRSWAIQDTRGLITDSGHCLFLQTRNLFFMSLVSSPHIQDMWCDPSNKVWFPASGRSLLKYYQASFWHGSSGWSGFGLINNHNHHNNNNYNYYYRCAATKM